MLKQFLLLLRNKLNYLKHYYLLPKNPKNNDVYVVEFPKSGITWFSFIIGYIIYKKFNTNLKPTFYNITCFITDVHQLRSANINLNPNIPYRFIKSHSDYNPHYYFVIYLLRNPYNVMVSYYHFMCVHGLNMSFEKFIKHRQYGIESWVKHVEGWLMVEKLEAQRICLIKYEELSKRCEETIIELCKNIGLDIEQSIIQEAIEYSNFEKMKESENLYRRYNPKYKLNFVRKAKDSIDKEDEKEFLTEELKLYIRQKSYHILEKFYPELL